MRFRGVRKLAGAMAPASGCAVLAGCTGQGAASPGAVVKTARAAGETTAGRTTTPGPTPSPTSKPAPAGPVALSLAPVGDGARHQTEVVPRTNDVAFRNLTTDLWLAVTTGNPSYGLPAFFPRSAYEQVKAIADPAYDWRTRLWDNYTIDVAPAHQLVGGDAHLVTVLSPAH